MKKTIDRMEVAGCMSLISCGIGIVNNTWIKSKALGIAAICIASGGIVLTVEDMVTYFEKES